MLGTDSIPGPSFVSHSSMPPRSSSTSDTLAMSSSGTEESESLAASSGQQRVVPKLSEEELKALNERVPKDEDGRLTSLGSMQHASGGCRPCVFFSSKVGCANAQTCNFCHFKHLQVKKNKVGEMKQSRYQRLKTRMEEMEGGDGSQRLAHK
eukprot:gnl/TRDRNA2_/TRDRNA2_90194_c0_seq3.p1 gnl/TRDRNA2_/TRDRNA2_90194_c0~~gnl/TRDRNA2_/TRDRNA2_90194_c0_seq3.p1  ORF type:complete len:152 (-),score=31.79 gnl/TRDRNA2_/TRDRNA2_90194_c0_seq3:113-568(-)